MRYRIFIALCVIMLGSAWAQEAGAVDAAPDGSQSAYDIFGLSPEGDAVIEPSQVTPVPVDVVDPTKVPAVGNVPAGNEQLNATGGDDAALRDEVMRLLAERDSLLTEIAKLRDENSTLAKAVQETDGFRARNTELEKQVARLEEDLASKENELASAEARIAEISAKLDEEGSRLAEEKARVAEAKAKVLAAETRLSDVEARLAASGGDQAAIDTLLAEKNAAIAERDVLLDAADTELSIRAAIIKAKDADIRVRDGQIVAKDVELAAAETDLAVSKKALADAQAALAEAKSIPATTPATTPAATSGPADAVTAKLLEAVADAERKVAALVAERDAAVAVRDAAVASREAAETMVRAAEAAKAEVEAALAAAKASGTVVRSTPATPAMGAVSTPTATATAVPVPAASAGPASAGYLSGWSLDTSKFKKNLRTGFDGSLARMGSWKITGQTAAQTDASQYFSRLEMPLAQGKSATLYRFKARSTGKGWIGLGLHIFVEDNKKKRGYGEGKSLLVWFTRDKSTRGDDATYLQLFRSDTDVVMERMFDAELQDGLAAWRLVEIVYDPVADYIAVSVDGVLRAVYKTFFGRDAGATVSLRTLGGGGAFQDFSAWTE